MTDLLPDTGNPAVSAKTLEKATAQSQKRAARTAAQAAKLAAKPKKQAAAELKFKWRGTDAAGKPAKGVISAPSYGEARLKLESSGNSIEMMQSARGLAEMEFGNPVPPQVLVQATRQLASFAQAGLPIAKGIEVMAETTEHKRMQRVFHEIHSELEAGSTLSEALTHHPKVFPVYYRAIVGAAERTGDLTGALLNLNDYLDRDLRSKRAVRNALYYPAVLFVLAIGAISILSVVVLPKFVVFFDSLGANLPVTTRALLWFTSAFSQTWYIILAGTILAWLAYTAIGKNPDGRLAIDGAKLRLPLFGGLITLVSIERFCRVLATLVQTQVPLPEALILAGRATGNRKYEVVVTAARQRVLAGEGLAEPLRDSGVFPTAVIQIFRIGEESGQLEQQLAQAAGFYSDEMDHRMKTFTGLLEPFVLVLIGGMVGFVAVALISAMYGIYNQVQ